MKIITFVFCFILSGCCSVLDNRTLSFSPSTLPAGVVGMKYYARVTISGVPVNWIEIDGADSYEKNGIVVSFNINSLDHQYIEIKGVPHSIELIKFNVRGSSFGTQCSGLYFDKEFEINVTDIDSRKATNIAFNSISDNALKSINPTDTKITTSCL